MCSSTCGLRIFFCSAPLLSSRTLRQAYGSFVWRASLLNRLACHRLRLVVFCCLGCLLMSQNTCGLSFWDPSTWPVKDGTLSIQSLSGLTVAAQNRNGKSLEKLPERETGMFSPRLPAWGASKATGDLESLSMNVETSTVLFVFRSFFIFFQRSSCKLEILGLSSPR